jgi:hypothetical protein
MKIFRNITPFAIVLALWLTACGSTPVAGGSASPTSSAASPSATTQANGCPTQIIPVDPQPAATVVVTQQNSGNPAPITLNIGESMEIHLSSTLSWHLNVADPDQSLSAITPEGWYNESLPACVWRYSAAKAGSATLTFTGTVLCPAGQQCPQLAVATEVAVTVK